MESRKEIPQQGQIPEPGPRALAALGCSLEESCNAWVLQVREVGYRASLWLMYCALSAGIQE